MEIPDECVSVAVGGLFLVLASSIILGMVAFMVVMGAVFGVIGSSLALTGLIITGIVLTLKDSSKGEPNGKAKE